MLKNKIIVLGAAAVLAVSLVGGATYAWFSAQASQAVGGDANENGIEGGLVAGHVDLLVDVESYTEVGGIPNPGINGKPYIIYPGDIVDQDGNSIADAKSIIKYSLENTSGTEVIARLDQLGLTLGQDGKINNLYINIRQLLGYDLDKSQTEQPNAATWFYFAKKPADLSAYRYVDINKLNDNSFVPDHMYKVNDIAANGNNFYAKARNIDIMNGLDTGVKVESKLDNPDGVLIWTDNAGTPNALPYFRMPAATKIEIEVALTMAPGTGDENNSNAFIGDNRYQFAVYTLAVKDDDQEDPENPRLYAYGTQVKLAALESFYGAEVATKIAASSLNTPVIK